MAVCVFFLTPLSLPAQQRWHAAATSQLSSQAPPPLEDMAHTSWVRRDGAPSDITALVQTKDGYLWVGSRLGLYRFDGLQFSSYPFTSADPQLPSSDIYTLAADRDGGLWIGYRMGGISYLHGSKKIDYDKHGGLVSESTGQLICRDDGSVWAIADGRLMHLIGSTWENYAAKHGLNSDGLYTLFFDRSGNLWTAEKGHVFELKAGEDKFLPVPIPNRAVNQFAQTPDGTIWISDAWNNVRPLFGDNGRQAVRIPGVPLLIVDNDGRLWLAHDFGGLTRITWSGNSGRRVENYSTVNGLTDGQTRAILKDKDGMIWVGTARGLDRFQRTPFVQFHGVRIDYHPALIADKKSGIWIDDMDKPLMLLRGNKLSFVGKAHGSSSLYQAPDGAVWLHDPITHNFFRYAGDGTAPTAVPVPEVATAVENWCLGQDQQGAFLACFEGHGLWRYTGKWERVTAPGMPQESPISLARGDSGRLWLGYPHNLIVLKDAAGFHIYSGNEGLTLNSVLTFYDADGVVLAGGSDGLAFFDGHRFHALQLRTPGVMRGVAGIVKDRLGDLWLSAGSGVIRLPASEWKAAILDPRYVMDFQFLNERDGLFGSPAQGKPAPSAVIDADGRLWFGTSGHLVSIDPAVVRKERAAPAVLLQTVLVNGSVFQHEDDASITVDSRHLRNLEFDYIGVDLQSPERVTYQYMLESQDKEWQDAGMRRQAYYTNLKPGNYRFRVRGAIGTGPWNELQAGVPLTITPAFYQTTWFVFLCAAIAIFLMWLAYQWRIRRVEALLNSQFRTRLSERTRIAQELHDTLLQGVLSASMQLHVANDLLAAESPAKPLLQRVLQLMGNVIEEGRNAVRDLRFSKDGPQDLEQAFSRIPEELVAKNGTDYRVIVEGASRTLHPMVRDEVFRIGREAVANAFRHSGATSIEVALEYGVHELRVSVRDNGCGIEPQVLRSGRDGHWGLSGMRERAERAGANLRVWSSAASGTEVDLRVPARIAFESRTANRAS